MSMLDSFYAWADPVGIQLLEWASDSKFFDASGKPIFPRPTKVSTDLDIDQLKIRKIDLLFRRIGPSLISAQRLELRLHILHL